MNADTLQRRIPINPIARRLMGETIRRAREAGEDPVKWQAFRSTPSGWMCDEDIDTGYRRVLLTFAPHAEWLIEHMDDDVDVDPTEDDLWLHASISHGGEPLTYADLTLLHHAVWGPAGWSYQVFAPESEHVNIYEALHLWGRLDGRKELPNFGALGTI